MEHKGCCCACDRTRYRREYMRVCNVPMLTMTCAMDVHWFVFVGNMCAECILSDGMSRGVYEMIRV